MRFDNGARSVCHELDSGSVDAHASWGGKKCGMMNNDQPRVEKHEDVRSTSTTLLNNLAATVCH